MKNRLHCLFILLIFFCTVNSAIGQYGLSIGRTMPRGDFGKVFKPSTLVELEYNFLPKDNPFKLTISVGFMQLKTVQDTFRIYGVYTQSGEAKASSGYELYENYFSIPIAFRTGYRFLETDLSPTAGIDAYLFFNSYKYESNIPGISGENEVGGSVFLGYQARIGLNYVINDQIDLDLNFGRTATWEQGDGKFIFWKTALGINVYFN